MLRTAEQILNADSGKNTKALVPKRRAYMEARYIRAMGQPGVTTTEPIRTTKPPIPPVD
jgi:hypothetical protein